MRKLTPRPAKDPWPYMLGIFMLALLDGVLIAIAALVWLRPQAPFLLKIVLISWAALMVIPWPLTILIALSPSARAATLKAALWLSRAMYNIRLQSLSLKVTVFVISFLVVSAPFYLLAVILDATGVSTPLWVAIPISVSWFAVSAFVAYRIYKRVPARFWKGLDRDILKVSQREIMKASQHTVEANQAIGIKSGEEGKKEP